MTIKQELTSHGFCFSELFPVLLTDNGGEFSNVYAFENDLSGAKETSVFFCDPNCPWQKPHVENNHTLLRNILPKGTSFDDLDQAAVNLIFSHVNAVKRKQFHGKSAYDMFCFAYSAELARILGVSAIDPKDVFGNLRLSEKRFFSDFLIRTATHIILKNFKAATIASSFSFVHFGCLESFDFALL